MNRLLLLCALAALPLAAQQTRFSATTGDVSLSAATTAFTIQRPAASGGQNGRDVALESATVYCSVACNVSQAYNGAAATATAGTATVVPPANGWIAQATVWTASNVGAGTAVGALIHVAAGQTVVLDLSKVAINGAGTAANYTVSISSITGTANITYVWVER